MAATGVKTAVWVGGEQDDLHALLKVKERVCAKGEGIKRQALRALVPGALIFVSGC